MNDETVELEEDLTGSPPETRLDGVVIGVLTGFNDEGAPLVVYPGNDQSAGRTARASATLGYEDVGREVALLFEAGDPDRPLIIGRIQHPEEMQGVTAPQAISADIDGERIEFRAKKEIVLRCGKASITLTRAGKILIRGAYVLSRSSGANRIKGGSVQIN